MELVLPERAVGLVNRFLSAIDSGTRADRLLAKLLREAPELSSAERALVAEWCLGICVWRGRLDALARGDRALWFPLFLIDREHRPLDEVARRFELDPALLSSALQLKPGEDGAEQIAFRRSLPLWLAQRWIDQFGVERTDAIAAAMNVRGPVAIRADGSREELQARLVAEGVTSHPSSLAPHGLVLEGRVNIVGLEAWRAGLFEVQDEGSQLIAEAVEARPGETILELCAGSGGKTLALAAAMRNTGRLICVDSDAQRLADLQVRARRHRVSCAEIVCADARRPESIPCDPASADAVLLDAPCSSTGTLRRSPDGRWRLRSEEASQWAEVQRQLLASAQQFVRPGGRLVYATCSIDREENESVAQTVPTEGFELLRQRRTSPDVDGCDGFFWSVWRRHS